jgi:hypothetical protein
MMYSSLLRLSNVRIALPSIMVPALIPVSPHTRQGSCAPVAKKFGPWLQETVDANVVFGVHVEVGGHGWMMANLLCQVERF